MQLINIALKDLRFPKNTVRKLQRSATGRREPSRLEATHLACGRSAAGSRLAADDPTHRRIMTQPLGVVDVLVSGQPPEHGLPQRLDTRMPAVLAGAGVGEPLAGQIRKAKSKCRKESSTFWATVCCRDMERSSA